MSPDTPHSVKDQRLNLRVTAPEKALIEQAARLSRTSASEFVLQCAVRQAEALIADRTRFILSAEEWAAFTAALDRPARDIPALRRAAAQPSPFGDR